MADERKPESDEFAGLQDDSAADVQAQYEAEHRDAPPKDEAPETAPSPLRGGPGRGSESASLPLSGGSGRGSGLLAETDPPRLVVPASKLKWQTRRDFVLFTLGGVLAAAAFWKALPLETETFHRHDDTLPDRDPNSRKEKILKEAITFDDAVATALYSPTRLVPTYDKAQVTPNLRNNYDGQTPDPGYLDTWTLTISGSGLAAGKDVTLDAHTLRTAFAHHEQITRLVCVEGWSAIAWWGGLRFADLLKRYPPKPDYAWASIRSEVNLDSDGNSDPYYVSIDIPTAMHPQTLLATHRDGKLLDVDHGAPLRLVAPMKLGLKNIKAITSITYTKDRPADYWGAFNRGYSQYDGV